MPKLKKVVDEPLLCSGCGANEPKSLDGWHTIIRAWDGHTTTICYCPACHVRMYGKPAEETTGATVH